LFVFGIQLGIEVGKLRMQLDDLQNKIACCGGGCISSCTQVELWKHIGYHAIHVRKLFEFFFTDLD
jgi:hypothetical protein